MLEEVVSRIGIGATLTAVGAIDLNPSYPRYTIGAVIGIPLATILPEVYPVVSAPLGAAYLAGLAGYGAATLAHASQRVSAIAILSSSAMGALGAIASRYL